MLVGVYRCDNCGNQEQTESEVICWECGQGEMIWAPAKGAERMSEKPPSVKEWLDELERDIDSNNEWDGSRFVMVREWLEDAMDRLRRIAALAGRAESVSQMQRLLVQIEAIAERKDGE